MKWETAARNLQNDAGDLVAVVVLLLLFGAALSVPLIRRWFARRRRRPARSHTPLPTTRSGSAYERRGPGYRSGPWKNSSNVRPFPMREARQPRRDLSDPAAQMHAISAVAFERRRALNDTEYRVLLLVEEVVSRLGEGHRVLIQPSLGELIAPKRTAGDASQRRRAYASINSKRLDLAVIDHAGLLALAIEVQGSGHYQNHAFMRDAVKREALRRAGVRLLEVPVEWTDEDILHAVARELSRLPAQPAGNWSQA